MEQHPVPRQITTFKFKLVGFMTLEQFIYIILFVLFGYLAYAINPIPVLRQLGGVIVALIGPLIAFVPYNDRPLDQVIRSLVLRLFSPTQYMYHKENAPIYFLQDLFFASDPHHVLAHVDSKAKLAKYMAQTQAPQPTQQALHTRMQSIQAALAQAPATPLTEEVVATTPEFAAPAQTKARRSSTTPTPTVSATGSPFLYGVVKNKKGTPLPDVLIYFKDSAGKSVRLLKSNPHGVFATYTALSVGDYEVEVKETSGRYFFDTIKVQVTSSTPLLKPIEITSREVL